MSAALSTVASSPYLEMVTPGVVVRLELDGARLTIGRDPSNLAALRDKLASRFHCVVERLPNGYRLRDLGSRNGTLVNDRRVEFAKLRAGDVITVGHTRFCFRDPHEIPTWSLD